MDEVIAAAEKLGRLLSESERYRALRQAEDAVRADPVAGKLVEQIEAQRRKIAGLEAAMKPVEPADKHELQRLLSEAHSNATLQSLARRQADYMEMMQRVNAAVQGSLEHK